MTDDVTYLIGLTRSEKTSVMCTPKRGGTLIWQIKWQIYPPGFQSIMGKKFLTSLTQLYYGMYLAAIVDSLRK